jgi:hypothetical protein
MKIELRWVSRKTGHQYLDGTVVKDVREQVLQYRISKGEVWELCDWTDIPTVKEEDQ